MAWRKICYRLFTRPYSTENIPRLNSPNSTLDIELSQKKWIESKSLNIAIKKEVDKENPITMEESLSYLQLKLAKLIRIVMYKKDFEEFLRNNYLNKNIRSQQFLSERVRTLGPNLAVSHFIVYRGGSVKFWGNDEWFGRGKQHSKLPPTFVPGYYVEAINADGINMFYEGLTNLYDLKKLKWLSLKGCIHLNDFGLDIISSRYGPQLEYLDLSGCTGITHCGLSCFYRFTNLKVVNFSGMEHTIQFKLSCLLLQDLFPDLDIRGVDFTEKKLPPPPDENNQDDEMLKLSSN